ncbi:sphingomyelin phosphodiesterase 5 [Syngnathus typhle]|uniref:sphingomyelin phosphodiesterase 5 n=1 Tax=Syngnathus typhle TaxID=161592 RepID=UPI002A6ABA94|nr:sphingomyelin phosphodiesterase 5 [Syngnathus typhle]XP_061144743.1 sphingomyelin phosphodiesterase 5 [Syngnathus typhle]XP_061144744.1 sphingomyelin phosphodiesterase 5 [Syngnathus typhle]
MALQSSPFSNRCAAVTHAAGWVLILPCFWFLDRLIAVCKLTTLERRREDTCYLYPLKVVFGSIVFLVLFVVTAPVALLGFLLWAPLQGCRRPFCYHRESASLQSETHTGLELEGKGSFVFASANLCLLPDSLARFNNLGHTQKRATAIGECIARGVGRPNIRIVIDSPSSGGALSPSNSILPTSSASTYGATDRQASIPNLNSDVVYVPCDDTIEPSHIIQHNSNQNSNRQNRRLLSQGLSQLGDVPWEVSTMFPAHVDILCLEEVFDKRAAQKLTHALSPLFAHILYDIGGYACQPPCSCSSFKFFNSGLFLASRFPVVDAEYHCFPNSKGEDALAAKGLLSTKVLLGKNLKQTKLVGYFNCIHLHAPEGEGAIRCEQLNMVTKWIGDFQAANRQADEEVVFDVLCGDFNFDNCSPDDTLEQNHSLFEEYKDPCRAGPGKEKPWVIGTLLEQPTLYDDAVNSPENLQKTLENDMLRKRYICPPVPAAGSPFVYPEIDQPWIGRRIDYILFRENSISKHCQTEVEEVSFITQLAGLTDHIPVGLRLNVRMDS